MIVQHSVAKGAVETRAAKSVCRSHLIAPEQRVPNIIGFPVSIAFVPTHLGNERPVLPAHVAITLRPFP